MFPLLSRDRANPLELFQIWLNLPAADKMAAPHFAMLWRHEIPRVVVAPGARVEVTLVAGSLDGHAPPAPPPKSWAARSNTDVRIWVIRLAAGATWDLPTAHAESNRRLYFYRGTSLSIAGESIPARHSVDIRPDVAITLAAGLGGAELLLLQGRPIAEPVAQYGPFVMNTRAEVQEAFADFQRTQFGGWPWPVSDPVHAVDEGRFARHADGTIERPSSGPIG
jgi:redox-sensitive bicupin YhaK (pirin superfamily)